MYILIPTYNINHIYILPSKSNYILKNGWYNKLLYSNENITLNGLYISIKLNNLQYFKKYNKYYLRFSNTLEDIIELEEQILSKYNNNKTHSTIIKTSIKNKSLLINSRQNITGNHFILYISGIWENNNEIGLIYKIIPSNHQLLKNTD